MLWSVVVNKYVEKRSSMQTIIVLRNCLLFFKIWCCITGLCEARLIEPVSIKILIFLVSALLQHVNSDFQLMLSCRVMSFYHLN